MVSQDIQGRRDEYMALMLSHGVMARDEIVESVRRSQAEFLSILRGVDEAQALRKPAPDEWSLRDLALHAAFTERLIAKLIHHLARGEAPSAEDLRGAGIGMMPEDDGRPFARVVSDVATMNEAILTAVRNLPKDADTQFKAPHPFFGPLNCLEWAGFQVVHDTDHIQHAGKIIASTHESN